MNTSTSSSRGGRTRWRRSAILFVPSIAVVGVLAVGMAQGALAASFGVSGGNVKLTADTVSADGMSAYMGTASSTTGAGHPVMLAGITSASLRNMCASAVVDVPIFGPVSMNLFAGKQAPVEGSTITADASSLVGGDASVSGMQAGRDASTLDAAPGFTGTPGAFGFQAKNLSANNFRATAWQATGGTMKLSGLELDMSAGVKECY